MRHECFGPIAVALATSLVVACSESRDGSSEGGAALDATPPDAAPEVHLAAGCPGSPGAGNTCSSDYAGLVCDYSGWCEPGKTYVLATCVGDAATGTWDWSMETRDCNLPRPTREDGCPVDVGIDSTPCEQEGKSCAYDDFCPGVDRVTMICGRSPDGRLIWKSREDPCP